MAIKNQSNKPRQKKRVLNRNEDTSQYFEKVFTALEFTKLIKADSKLSYVEIKPDRKGGAKRRIEDITRFFEDKSIEVIQLKYTDVADSSWTYSGLWDTKETAQKKSIKKNSKYEGTVIFKFLKAWRFHKGQKNKIKLILASNKPLGTDLKKFFSDIKKLNQKKITWNKFNVKYKTELLNIKSNFTNTRLKPNELEAFIKSFEFQISKDIKELDSKLQTEFGILGISDKDRIDAFFARTYRKFTEEKTTFRKADVLSLIEIIKTSLIHEIQTPKNYIQRKSVEAEILKAVNKQKKKGGFVFLFAPSGSGKTVLLSKLTQTDGDFLPYLCRIRPFEKIDSNLNYEKERLSSMWFKVDLIQRFFDLGLTKETVSLKDNEEFINNMFEKTLNQVSESALKRRGKKIVIIVDALDQVETDNYKDKSILNAIPSVQYAGVVFLLSTWTKEYLPQQIKNLPDKTFKKVSISLAFSDNEIKEYFTNAEINLTLDQLRKIAKKTKGLAISIFYLTQKLKKISRKEYDTVIDSQEDYKEVFDWYKPIWDSLNTEQQHCLGCLSFHFAEIQRDTLYKIAKIKLKNFNTLNEKISPFVSLRGGYIEPYHDSFRRFIRNKLISVQKEYNQEITKFYSTKSNLKLAYPKKYLTNHLQVIGSSDPFVKQTTKKLIQNNFIQIIFDSKLDYVSKIKSLHYFIKYFDIKNDLQNFIKYSIKIGNLSPVINSNDDVFLKSSIGTPSLLKEVESELAVLQDQSSYSLREWVMKRIRLGNFLYIQEDSLSKNLSLRFLEDGLARISFNREILWDTKENGNADMYWENIVEYLEACINLGRYNGAVRYIQNIRFKEPKPHTVGFRASMLVKLNRVQYTKDVKAVLNFIKKQSKAIQLITYTYIFTEKNDTTAKKKLKPLIKQHQLFKYLINDRYINQRLDIAEASYFLNVKESKSSISKLISGVDFEPPYHRDMYSNWGINGKGVFLRRTALLSLVSEKFSPKEFFIDAQKKYHKEHFKDYENDAFANIVSIHVLLYRNLLLVKNKKMDWKRLNHFLMESLNVFKNEISKVSEYKQLRESPFDKTTFVYYQNATSFAGICINTVAKYFPKKLESFVDTVEMIFKNTILEKNEGLLEEIFDELLPITPALIAKIELYQKKIFEFKTKEQQDNFTKSDSLKELARTVNSKGYKESAEDIYKHSLKYSRGLWAKEDLRILNLIDCLRTQTKKEDFETILKYIDKISNIVEGSWYYKLGFIESVTHSNYEAGLDYLVELTNKGEVNLNEGLKKVILTSLNKYNYKTITPELIPLLDLLRFDEETDREQPNIQAIYYALIDHSSKNNDILRAKFFLSRYCIYLRRYVYVGERLPRLKGLAKFIEQNDGLTKEYGEIEKYISQLELDGYSVISTNSNIELIPSSVMEQAKSFARNKSMKKIRALLDSFIKEDKKYKIDGLILEIVSNSDLKTINKVKEWCRENNVEFFTYNILCSLLDLFIKNQDKARLKEVKKDILDFCNNQKYQYNLPELINKLAQMEFQNKKEFLRKVIRLCIYKSSESGYYLNYLLVRTSDVIDSFFPELKKYAFYPLKETVEESMRLSLTKA